MIEAKRIPELALDIPYLREMELRVRHRLGLQWRVTDPAPAEDVAPAGASQVALAAE